MASLMKLRSNRGGTPQVRRKEYVGNPTQVAGSSFSEGYMSMVVRKDLRDGRPQALEIGAEGVVNLPSARCGGGLPILDHAVT